MAHAEGLRQPFLNCNVGENGKVHHAHTVYSAPVWYIYPLLLSDIWLSLDDRFY